MSSISPNTEIFSIDDEGWLTPARHLLSPNHNHRDDSGDISLLVIHNISLPPGQFGTGCIEDFFCNQLDCSSHEFFGQIQDLKVSAHFLVDRAGSITQFVPTIARAWHAGVSCFDGREACNDFSIGIELEGTDDEPYTTDQYSALQGLTKALMCRHADITQERISGHCDIAPGRKTDPGPAFDWSRFRAGLHSSQGVSS
mgnify:CR=1 FL=1